jgi:hypothetical protein
MTNLFPQPITELPEADIAVEGARAYLMQGSGYQILFTYFERNAEISGQALENQMCIVLGGRIDIRIDAFNNMYQKGDRYFIPKGARYYADVYAGYSEVSFVNQGDRYRLKNPPAPAE